MRTPVVALAMVVVLSAPAGRAAATNLPPNHFTEDFTTTTYRNTSQTTAWWDASTGELKLPDVIQEVGTYSDCSGGHAVDAVVDGHYLYLAYHNCGFRRVDVSDPSNPVRDYTDYTSGFARGVAVYGNVAYVAADDGGVDIFEFTDAGVNRYYVSTPGRAYAVLATGRDLYVADDTGGVRYYDISNPTSPVLQQVVSGPQARCLFAHNGNLYVGGVEGSLWIYENTRLYTNPLQLITTWNSGDQVRAVQVTGNYAYLANYSSGLTILDVSDPTIPSVVATMPTNSLTLDVEVHGNLAIIADYNSGIRLIDVSNVANPTPIAARRTASHNYTVTLAGEYAYATDWSGGVEIFRVRALGYPYAQTSKLSLGAGPSGCAIFDNNLYFATRDILRVFDVSDPMSPTEVGTALPPSYRSFTEPLVVRGRYLLPGGYSSSSPDIKLIYSYDLADPLHPANPNNTWVGLGSSPDTSIVVEPYDDMSFFAAPVTSMTSDGVARVAYYRVDGSSGHISTDYLGRWVWKAPSPYPWGVVTSMEAWGTRYLFVGIDRGSGGEIYTVDVSDPANMHMVASMGLVGVPNGMIAAGGYLYVAAGTQGLLVYGVGSNGSLSHVTTVAPPHSHPSASAHALALEGKQLCVGWDSRPEGYASGWWTMYDVSDPAHPVEGFTKSFSYQVAHPVFYGDHLVVWGHRPTETVYANTGFDVYPVYQNFVPDTAVAVSLPVSDTGCPECYVYYAKLDAQYSGNIRWFLSANGGSSWTEVTPGTGYRFYGSNSGNQLVWKAELAPDPAGGNDPVCTQVSLDWYYYPPFIQSITDVPGDNGGQVTLRFTASALEMDGSADYYKVFRLDPPGDTYVLVDSLAASGADFYERVVPTAADSNATGTHYQRFQVAVYGHVWFVPLVAGSPPDSGYSVDNLAPAAPQNFTVAYNTGSGNRLHWSVVDSTDVDSVVVHRATAPDFVPSDATRVAAVAGGATWYTWSDPDYDGWPLVYYKLIAYDRNGQASPPAFPTVTTDAGAREPTPERFALHANVPNPFNPFTRIRYDVPARGGRVRIVVYDVQGHRVRVLVDEVKRPGRYEVAWRGRDDRGRRVASGVYFCRMEAPGFSATRKMSLLK